ncbi:MAG: hypothetical protein ACRD2F_07045 [Terriglobales bacterium]
MTPRHFAIGAATALAFALAGCGVHSRTVPPTEVQAPAPAPAPAAISQPAAASAASLAPDPDAASMPAGPAKEDVVTLCTQCHTLHRIVTKHLSRANWAYELHVMQGNGLSATPAQLKLILDYLAKHYPPQS